LVIAPLSARERRFRDDALARRKRTMCANGWELLRTHQRVFEPEDARIAWRRGSTWRADDSLGIGLIPHNQVNIHVRTRFTAAGLVGPAGRHHALWRNAELVYEGNTVLFVGERFKDPADEIDAQNSDRTGIP
jgi:hypothetical protein